jgi:hypothetical protein
MGLCSCGPPTNPPPAHRRQKVAYSSLMYMQLLQVVFGHIIHVTRWVCRLRRTHVLQSVQLRQPGHAAASARAPQRR